MHSDLVDKTTHKLVSDSSAPVAQAAELDEESVLSVENSLFAKIRFAWKPQDREILDRIRIQADSAFEEAFADSITIVDDFYLQLRVPEQRNGIVLKGSDGRPVWQKDEQGRPIERWSQLTGQDIQTTLLNLERLRFSLAPRVNRMFLEALYARHVATDTHDDHWESIMDGTQGDKMASSNKASRIDRYHAYFLYYVWSTAKTFLDELDRFSKMLKDFCYWQVNTQKG